DRGRPRCARLAGGVAARVLRGRQAGRLARAARTEGRLDRGAARVIHELPYERSTLHGHFSRDLPTVLTVDPRDSVPFSCPNAGGRVGPDETFEPRDEELDAGHALVGPIEVRGARAGQTLVVHIDEVRPGTFGETFGPDVRVEWVLDPDAATGTDDRGATVR